MDSRTALEAYKQRIAERGLRFLGFDGYSVSLSYDVRADGVANQPPPQMVSGDEINRFAIEAMNGLPGGEVFPGVRRVVTHWGLDL